MNSLVWKPQKAFAPHFLTDANDIISRRTIFAPDVIYHVDYGGRGSAKTWTWADAIVVEASLRPVRILVTREFQISIEESVKDEIESAISNRGLDGFFDCQKSVIIGLNGSRFIFKGIKNNIKNLKSISNVDIVLCEEAENIQKDSWEKLLPSIRPKSGKDPIFIIIFNPDNELDDTYQRWVLDPPPQTISLLINWRQNKYFPEFLNKQRLHAKKTLPQKEYDHTWEGKPKGPGGDVIIDLEWVKAARFASNHPEWPKSDLGKRVGYDPAGQGKDSHAVCFIDGNSIVDMDEWPLSSDLREATKRALSHVRGNDADEFSYDECGGFGDGVSVFVNDNITGEDKDSEGNKIPSIDVSVVPFNAGDKAVNPDDIINGTNKTNGETYSNHKAQGHGTAAQLFYNTFRFIVMGERDIDADDLISIDCNDEHWIKLRKEASTPIWVKSEATSKKKVESKKDMEKRTGQKSPNLLDSVIMIVAPKEIEIQTAGALIPSHLL